MRPWRATSLLLLLLAACGSAQLSKLVIELVVHRRWNPKVLVETGGMLSHAATVAREFGIPCVVLVEDATRIIRDGDTVTVTLSPYRSRFVRATAGDQFYAKLLQRLHFGDSSPAR